MREPEEGRIDQLLAEARGGNSAAFSRLAERYLPFLSREVGKYVPACDVEDVVQETLIRMYRAIGSYQESGRFDHWVRRIVGRASLDYWRTVRRRGRLEQALFWDAETTPQDLGSKNSGLRKDLERCLAQLSPEDRMVCVMAFLEERSHREIAEILGSTAVAVKVRCFRMRNKLKAWISL